MREQSLMPGIRMPPAYVLEPEALLEAYRRGDPFRVMAANFEGTADDICQALVKRSTTSKDELERYRSVRRRTQATMDSMWANRELITRLDDSGIESSKIPVILDALGKSIDVQVAAELLHLPGIPTEKPGRDNSPRQIGDKLSLLYVMGMHHGIAPDYALALGKMSLEAVGELRDLFHPTVPYFRTAEVLAVIEATAMAVRTGKITSLSCAAYEDTAEKARRDLGHVSREKSNPWPVPAPQLIRRCGQGYWEDVLSSLGLGLLSADHRFSEDDYFQAVDDFTEECIDFEYPMDIDIYDRWVFAEMSIRQDRPSAMELIGHYGSWDEAIEAVLPQEQEGDEEPDTHEFYWGFPFGFEDESLIINELASHREAEEWHQAGELIGQLLAEMPWNSFLRIEYDGSEEITTRPYAQATPSADGVWCEIVSEQYLPAAEWPINRRYFENNDWAEPDDEAPNWWKARVPLTDAGRQLVLGLRLGRGCRDAHRLRWSTGEFPSGPGPDGGALWTMPLPAQYRPCATRADHQGEPLVPISAVS
ncbi:TY-Chap domain-containing protein [Arthrobacter sp. SAFR-044]|uniref:TY-Chap domain-containing protein n=1 Tax=Arthrobacter sp. SAFR-044 TaxID=3387278 RepID=UPI003F7B84B2